MKRFEANYLVHTNVEALELVDSDTQSLKIMEVEKVSSEELSTSMFKIKLSFRAADNLEALRMAAINTDQSVLQFKEGSEPFAYNIKLEEIKWLGRRKLREDQSYSFSSLSA